MNALKQICLIVGIAVFVLLSTVGYQSCRKYHHDEHPTSSEHPK